MPDPAPDKDALARLLATDPADVGCAETLALLDVYVDALLAGGSVERTYPGIAAHLRDCAPCAEDLAGLLAAVRAERDADPGRGR
ncbi:MAG TPA: hypothetical protein VHA76_06040 [Solirubrobacterales bacterium]|nr:hypothetical protein [Solirubrobacterales bacterium]